MTIPQEVMLSVYRDITDDLALMANFNWQNWSQFGEFDIALDTVPPRARAVDADFDDTFQGAIGAHYKLGEPTTLLLGFAYDSSPAKESNRSPGLPLDQQFRFAAGVQYEINEAYTVGAAYEYASLGSADIKTTRPSGTVQGSYDPNSLNVFNFNVVRRF